MGTEHLDLGLTERSAAGGCCGGACACGDSTSAAVSSAGCSASESADMVVQHFDMTGLTCSNCVNHVSTAVSAIDGVCCVDIDLHAGSQSKLVVTSPSAIDPAAIAAAVSAAGYQLA